MCVCVCVCLCVPSSALVCELHISQFGIVSMPWYREIFLMKILVVLGVTVSIGVNIFRRFEGTSYLRLKELRSPGRIAHL